MSDEILINESLNSKKRSKPFANAQSPIYSFIWPRQNEEKNVNSGIEINFNYRTIGYVIDVDSVPDILFYHWGQPELHIKDNLIIESTWNTYPAGTQVKTVKAYAYYEGQISDYLKLHLE